MISSLRSQHFVKFLILLSIFILSYSLLYAQEVTAKSIYKTLPTSPIANIDIDVGVFINFRSNRKNQESNYQDFEYTNYIGDPIRFGKSTSLEYWIKVKRADNANLNNLLIVLKPISLNEVDLYIPSIDKNNPIESSKPNAVNTIVKYSKRAYVFALPENTEYELAYLRIKSKNNTKLDVELWNADEYYKVDTHFNTLLSLLYGVLLILIVINLLFFIALRQNKYLQYSAYIIGLLIVLASASGKIFEYTFVSYIATSSNMIIFFKAASALLLTLLIQNLANLKNTAIELFKLTKGVKQFFALIMALCLILHPLPSLIINIFDFTIILFVLMCIVIPLLSWHSEKRDIRYVFYSIIPIIIAFTVFSLTAIGSLPNNIYTQLVMQDGLVLHAVIIAYGLSRNVFDIKNQFLMLQETNRQHILSLEIEKQHADLISHVKSYIRFNPEADQEHEIVTRFFDQLRPLYTFEKAALIYQMDSKLQVKTDFKKYQPHFTDFINENLIKITRLCHGNSISEFKPKNMSAHFNKKSKFMLIPVFLRGQEWSGMLINMQDKQEYTATQKDSLHRYATEVVRSLLNTQIINDIRAELKEDPVSKLLNRAAIFEELDLLIKDTQYSNKPSSIALLKVSGFIHIKEDYGQEVAHALLRYVADNLKTSFDDKVLLGRTANADFLLLFKDSTANEASKLLSSMRNQLKPMAVKDMYIDIQMCLAVAQCHGAFEPARDIMRRVDKGIQAAQHSQSDLIIIQE